MPLPPLLPAHVALALLLPLLGAGTASAQVLHTFTSGPPPVGDGIDYPRTINPARQNPGGGVAPDLFDTGAGTIFQNSNGNPAFFDANNLLTRPAQRITNEAFWTDPKIGVFESGLGFDVEHATFGFQFSPRAGEDFGFDLAIASVGEAPPTSLPFFIQNTDGIFGTFSLGLTPGGGDVAPTETGTFDTLNSPFQGREARFRIPHAQIEALLGDSAPLLIFSIDLFDVSTLGGTTQVALDNFVLAGASALPNEPQREPVRFQSELLPPGELLFFILDPSGSGETGVLVDVGGLPLDAVIELAARAAALPGSALPEVTSTLTIPADSPLRDEPSVELRAPGGDAPPPASPVVTPLGGLQVGGEAPFPVDATYFLEAITQLRLPQAGVTISTTDLTTLSELERSTTELSLTLMDLETLLVELQETTLYAGGLLPAAGGRTRRGADETFTLYLNYTLEEYLAERASLGQGPVVGDTGGAYTPLTDDEGQPVDVLLETWAVADEPGEFAQVLFVPEPGGAGMLAVGAAVLAAAARRRRGV